MVQFVSSIPYKNPQITMPVGTSLIRSLGSSLLTSYAQVDYTLINQVMFLYNKDSQSPMPPSLFSRKHTYG